MTLYQFLPYPENKPTECKFYWCEVVLDGIKNERMIYWNNAWAYGETRVERVISFLAPVAADPEDEKAAEVYAEVNYSLWDLDVRDISETSFLAGCAHKAQTTYTRQQMEDCWEARLKYFYPDRDTFINSLKP